jgi:putative oxidoreductase
MKFKQKPFNDFFFGSIKAKSSIYSIVLLLARIYAGYTLMLAGLGKLPLPNWMTEQVVEMGLPLPVFFAWSASWIEFAMGCLLILGLLTRFSAALLALVIGVAAFAYHQVIPLGEMHITQSYFWLLLILSITGGGAYAFDHFINRSEMNFRQRMTYTGIPALVILLAMGLYLENSPPVQAEKEETFKIESVHIAGNFNEWNPADKAMESLDSLRYSQVLEFEGPFKLQFKFTSNGNWDHSLGDINQESTGFPLVGIAEVDGELSTPNIESYIPAKGKYRITLDLSDLSYRIDSLKKE